MSRHSGEAYQFNIIDGAVAAVYKSEHGRLKEKAMDADEAWSVQGNNVVKTEFEHGRLDVTTYADADGDGFYSKVSKSSAVAIADHAAGRSHEFDHGSHEVVSGDFFGRRVEQGVIEVAHADSDSDRSGELPHNGGPGDDGWSYWNQRSDAYDVPHAQSDDSGFSIDLAGNAGIYLPQAWF